MSGPEPEVTAEMVAEFLEGAVDSVRRGAVETADPEPGWDIEISCPYCGNRIKANMVSPTKTPQEVRFTCDNRRCDQEIRISFGGPR